MSKIRVMMLASSYSIGGLETDMDCMIRYLDKKRYELFMILVYPMYKAKRITKKQRTAHRQFFSWRDTKTIEVVMKSRYDFLIIPRIARLMKQYHTDILYFFALGSATFIAPIAGRLARIPHIVRRNDTILDGLYPKFLKGLDRILISWIDRIVVPSEFLKRLFTEVLRIDKNKIAVIPNAIDLNKFSQTQRKESIRKELKLDSNSKVVGMIANLIPVKDHEVLLRAAPTVLKRFPEVCFVFVGEGPLRNGLEEMGCRIGISKSLRFLGYRPDVEEIIPFFHVGLLCSKVETHSIALIEMMASGIPVVAPRVGGIPEIITQGMDGLFVPQGDSEKLAFAIIRLLEEPRLARKIGENGKKRVFQCFSKETMIQSNENLFQTLYTAS